MLNESGGSSMQEQSIIKSTDPDKKYRRVLAASTLAGDQVQNTAGENLGKVDEIMIDIPAGKVAYAVLSFGGFLGMGNKLFAVPWRAIPGTTPIKLEAILVKTPFLDPRRVTLRWKDQQSVSNIERTLIMRTWEKSLPLLAVFLAA